MPRRSRSSSRPSDLCQPQRPRSSPHRCERRLQAHPRRRSASAAKTRRPILIPSRGLPGRHDATNPARKRDGARDRFFQRHDRMADRIETRCRADRIGHMRFALRCRLRPALRQLLGKIEGWINQRAEIISSFDHKTSAARPRCKCPARYSGGNAAAAGHNRRTVRGRQELRSPRRRRA